MVGPVEGGGPGSCRPGPSLSQWSLPMVPVRKPDGTVRLCIDFRRVNGITVPDPFQIPLIEDLLDSLSEAKYLSKLDDKGVLPNPCGA